MTALSMEAVGITRHTLETRGSGGPGPTVGALGSAGPPGQAGVSGLAQGSSTPTAHPGGARSGLAGTHTGDLASAGVDSDLDSAASVGAAWLPIAFMDDGATLLRSVREQVGQAAISGAALGKAGVAPSPQGEAATLPDQGAE